MKRGARLLAAAGASLALAACGNILGLKDLEPLQDAGTEGGDDVVQEASGDGTTDSVTPPGDAADTGVVGDGREEDGALGDVNGMDSSMLDSTTDMDSSQADTSMPDTSTTMDSSTSCETGTTDCGGQCVDLLGTDSHNCGACLHDCLGGACTAGRCGPFALASTTADDIVVVGSWLYWVDGVSQVWRCDTSTTCTPAPVATVQAKPTRIAFDGSSTLFWTNNNSGVMGSVGTYTVGGSATQLVGSLGGPQGIAASLQYVFWTDTVSNTVVRYVRGTSMGTPYTRSGAVPTGITLDSTDVYWAEEVSGNIQQCAQTPWTPSPSQDGTGQAGAWAISVTGPYVYWVNYAAIGSVYQYDTTSTVLNRLGFGVLQANPVRIVSDTKQVYWVNFGTMASDGQLMECDPTSTVATPLMSNLQKPIGLAIDANAIYYGTTGGTAKLWRLAR